MHTYVLPIYLSCMYVNMLGSMKIYSFSSFIFMSVSYIRIYNLFLVYCHVPPYSPTETRLRPYISCTCIVQVNVPAVRRGLIKKMRDELTLGFEQGIGLLKNMAVEWNGQVCVCVF